MKIGIIGTNFISEIMLQSFKQISDYNPVIVCSRNIDNAKDFASKHNIEHFTNDYTEFLNYDLDAVYIATPNVLHKDMALYFLNNKIPVFCEKPMASNFNEVKELVDASIKNKTLLMEGTIPIYTEGLKVLKNNLDHIKPIRSAVLSMNQYSSRYDAYKEGKVLNAFKRELSNGSMMDIGIYPLSVAISLFDMPASITSTAFLLDTKVDGSGTIVLHYDDKDVVISHSKINDQYHTSHILGEKATLEVNHISLMQEVTLYNKLNTEVIYKDYDTSPMTFELTAFKNALENNQIESFDGAHQLSLNIHKILTEARRQANVIFPADEI